MVWVLSYTFKTVDVAKLQCCKEENINGSGFHLKVTFSAPRIWERRERFSCSYLGQREREGEERDGERMALSESGSIPANPSSEVREEAKKFTKSISTREPSFSEHHHFVPPRLSSTTISHSLPVPTTSAKPDHFLTSHQCLASVLKKDGQILSIAVASNGFVYTGSESNVIRVWKLPELIECDQLKSRARMVVAIVVSNDKLYAAYADRKIRVWCRASDRVAKHVRLATFPRSAGSLFGSYIFGGGTMVSTV